MVKKFSMLLASALSFYLASPANSHAQMAVAPLTVTVTDSDSFAGYDYWLFYQYHFPGTPLAGANQWNQVIPNRNVTTIANRLVIRACTEAKYNINFTMLNIAIPFIFAVDMTTIDQFGFIQQTQFDYTCQ